jgi:hypothetical protein
MIGLSPSTYYYQPARSRESREREDVLAFSIRT